MKQRAWVVIVSCSAADDMLAGASTRGAARWALVRAMRDAGYLKKHVWPVRLTVVRASDYDHLLESGTIETGLCYKKEAYVHLRRPR
jgi:hypothetical protein